MTKKFKQQQLPFYIIQLPNYKYPSHDLHGANLRQSQLEITQEIPHAGVIVTIDAGDSANIHPANKYTVGERGVNQALVNEYHHKKIIASGSLVKNITIVGNKAVVFFDKPGIELAGKNGNEPDSFEIADCTAPELFLKLMQFYKMRRL